MRLLRSTIHPSLPNLNGRAFHRDSVRAIVLRGEAILLLYTERYDDYTLPGGGIDSGEERQTALVRELKEETGAQNIRDIEAYGHYQEFRPWHIEGYDLVQMESYCYRCSIDEQLGPLQLEAHELANGMRPVWMNIYDAIAHNKQVMLASPKKGLSIERETFLLNMIAAELVS